VIRNPRISSRDSDRERWDVLRKMTPQESIAVGEALLASEIMELARCAEDDGPRSLAIALGIDPRSLGRCDEDPGGSKRV